MGGQCVAVFGYVEVRQDPAVDARVQGLHATIEHLGKSGHLGDVGGPQSRLAQRRRAAARGDEFEAQFLQPSREVDQSVLVVHAH